MSPVFLPEGAVAMKSILVKDLMVPLADYATVSEDATLFEAVMALEQAQERFDRSRDRHRAVLVLDKDGRVVGKISQLDVLRALEPRYAAMGDFKGSSRLGFSAEFIRSLIEKYSLWEKPLHDICRKASQIKVKTVMYSPTEGEYVEEDATLDKAIHQLVVGHHQSLLVTRGKEIVGIIRLTDVFREVCNMIKACEI